MTRIFLFLSSPKRKRLNNFQLKELARFYFRAALLILGSLILKYFEPEAKFTLDKKTLIVLSFAMLGSLLSFRVGMFFSSKVKGS